MRRRARKLVKLACGDEYDLDGRRQTDNLNDREECGSRNATFTPKTATMPQYLETSSDFNAQKTKIVDRGDLDSFFAEPSTSKDHITATIPQDLETPSDLDAEQTQIVDHVKDVIGELDSFFAEPSTSKDHIAATTPQDLETSSDLDAEQTKIVDHVKDVIGDLDSFFAEPSTSKDHITATTPQDLERALGSFFAEPFTSIDKNEVTTIDNESTHLFGSDYSDDDPNYIPGSDESKSSVSLLRRRRHLRGRFLIPESPEISERTHDHRQNNYDGSAGYVMLLLETVLQNVWLSVKPTKRRKKAMPSEWEKNMSRKRKIDGLPYSTKGKMRPAKVPKPIQCGNCKFKCTDNFSEDNRNALCRNYWNMDFVAKKNHILSLVKVEPVKTRRVQKTSNKKPRSFSKKCFFKKGGTEIQVCQNFFSATLCISLDVISDAIAKSDTLGIYTGNDQRGKKEPPNKTKECDVKFVQQHIESFPVMEAHYCRKDTKKKYLAPDVKSVSNMYSLYLEICEGTQREPVKESKYRSIFCEEYNIGFFHPKKDLCMLCTRYSKADDQTKLKMENEYQEHLRRKTISLAAKDADKARANSDKTFMSITVDLQAVLQIPSGGDSILYYLRKLVLLNYTVYESRLPNKAYCLYWTEVNGKKGSCEIGTCLLNYLSEEMSKEVKHITIFSDTCGGQNRNQFIAALLLWAVNAIDHIDIIEQKFLESGHTQMEVDSMHASIENASRNVSINSVADWKNIFKLARRKRVKTVNDKKYCIEPYKLREFKYHEMLDLKKLAQKLIKNRDKDNLNEKVNWMKIKRLKYVKGEKTKIFFNYDLSEEFRFIQVSHKQETIKTPKTRSRKCSNIPENDDEYPQNITRLYEESLPITEAKKKDLITMCRKKIIPDELHPWIHSLKTIAFKPTEDSD